MKLTVNDQCHKISPEFDFEGALYSIYLCQSPDHNNVYIIMYIY